MKTNTLDFDAQALRERILDLAMRGKLVPQDPNDEPASVLLEKIKTEKAELIKENILTQCWIMNRRIHDLALFILSKIESEDKANKVLVLLDV